MTFRRIMALACSWVLIATFVPAGLRAESAWPKGYELAERSESPNGRYGVLIPTRDTAGDDEAAAINSLVDLKTHRRLGVIRAAHYFSGHNHHSLSATWAADSSWCIVDYGARYGFATITLIEPHGATFTQVDLGQHIEEALRAVIAKQYSSAGSVPNAHFRRVNGGKILVSADSTSNPRSLDDQPSYFASFYGTFDVATKKWVRSEASKDDSGEDAALETAYSDGLDEGMTFDKEADRLAWFDQTLNQVYRAVRLVLPPERFAAVKKEQLAWLAQRNAQGSVAEKCESMGARIRVLRSLLH